MPKVKFDESSGIMQYEDFVSFYLEEIEGRAGKKPPPSLRPITGASNRLSACKTPKGETPLDTPHVEDEEQKNESARAAT